MAMDAAPSSRRELRRRLGLPLLVLFGTGITIGAGIYVLMGPWPATPASMLHGRSCWRRLVMGFTVASYVELSTRYPVSAGEAAYVRAAFPAIHGYALYWFGCVARRRRPDIGSLARVPG